MLIAIVEVATFDQRYPQRAEVADAGSEKLRGRMIFGRHRPALDLKRDAETIAAQRQWEDRTRGLYTRRCFEPVFQVDKKLALPVAVVFDFGQADVGS